MYWDDFSADNRAETGQTGRFPPLGDYASYCRCVNSTKLSNGKRKGQGNVKNGNLYLGEGVYGSGAVCHPF